MEKVTILYGIGSKHAFAFSSIELELVGRL